MLKLPVSGTTTSVPGLVLLRPPLKVVVTFPVVPSRIMAALPRIAKLPLTVITPPERLRTPMPPVAWVVLMPRVTLPTTESVPLERSRLPLVASVESCPTTSPEPPETLTTAEP